MREQVWLRMLFVDFNVFYYDNLMVKVSYMYM